MIDQKSQEEWFRKKKSFSRRLILHAFHFFASSLNFLLGSRQNLPLNHKLSLVSLSQLLKCVLYWNLRFFSLATNFCSFRTLLGCWFCRITLNIWPTCKTRDRYRAEVKTNCPGTSSTTNTAVNMRRKREQSGTPKESRVFPTSSDRRFHDFAKALLELVEKYLSEVFSPVHKLQTQSGVSICFTHPLIEQRTRDSTQAPSQACSDEMWLFRPWNSFCIVVDAEKSCNTCSEHKKFVSLIKYFIKNSTNSFACCQVLWERMDHVHTSFCTCWLN